MGAGEFYTIYSTYVYMESSETQSFKLQVFLIMAEGFRIRIAISHITTF